MLNLISYINNHPIIIIISFFINVITFFSTIYFMFKFSEKPIKIVFKFSKNIMQCRIAIYSNPDRDLNSTIKSMNVFEEKNIRTIIPNNDINIGKDSNLLVINYEDFSDRILKIIDECRNSTKIPVIIFANPGAIQPITLLNEITNRNNLTIVNYKGRLLNDIITSLITTEFSKN